MEDKESDHEQAFDKVEVEGINSKLTFVVYKESDSEEVADQVKQEKDETDIESELSVLREDTENGSEGAFDQVEDDMEGADLVLVFGHSKDDEEIHSERVFDVVKEKQSQELVSIPEEHSDVEESGETKLKAEVETETESRRLRKLWKHSPSYQGAKLIAPREIGLLGKGGPAPVSKGIGKKSRVPEESEESARDSPSPPLVKSRGKRTTKEKILTDEEEEDLVDWFRDHDVLYNRARKGYRETQMKNALIEEKAKTLGKTLAAVKTWLDSMRTQYGKLQHQGPSGTAKKNLTAREKWIVNRFSFLENHIRRMSGREAGTSSGRPQRSLEFNEAWQDATEDQQDTPRSPSSASLATTVPSAAKRKKLETDVAGSVSDILEEMRNFRSIAANRQPAHPLLKTYSQEEEAWKSLCTTTFLQGLGLPVELREEMSHFMMSKMLELKRQAREQHQ